MSVSESRSHYEARLLSLPHVVGVGCGTKKVRGVDTGQPCVCVLVRKKLPLASLTPPEAVPPVLEGVPTDVVEAGEVMALGVVAPPTPALARGVEVHRGRHRPLVGGISCGPTNFTLTGTVGLPLVYKGDVPCLLSNTHVIAPYWYNQGMRPEWYEKYGIKVGAPIRQPSLADGGAVSDYAAELLEWAEIDPSGPNAMDAAVARLTEDARPELLGLGDALSHALSLTKGLPKGYALSQTTGEYRRTGDLELGLVVQKSGRTSGVTAGRVAYTELSIRVGYPFGEALFQDQVAVEPAILQPGDSGSAIVASDAVVALGFAGSSVMSIATPIRRILERFGLSLRPPGTLVGEALASIEDSLGRVWGFDNRTKDYALYDPRVPEASDLKTLRDGFGYWVELTGDAVLRYGGREQPLYAGWNLIGWRET